MVYHCKYGARLANGACPKKPKSKKQRKLRTCKYGARLANGACPKKPKSPKTKKNKSSSPKAISSKTVQARIHNEDNFFENYDEPEQKNLSRSEYKKLLATAEKKFIQTKLQKQPDEYRVGDFIFYDDDGFSCIFVLENGNYVMKNNVTNDPAFWDIPLEHVTVLNSHGVKYNHIIDEIKKDNESHMHEPLHIYENETPPLTDKYKKHYLL